MKVLLTGIMTAAIMLATLIGLTSILIAPSTNTVSAAVDIWSRMDLPSTSDYQMLPDSDIWDLTAADDGTLFALVEDTSGAVDVMGGGAMVWDGLRWAVYPAHSDIAVFKSTDGGYTWSLAWHVPSSEGGAPVALIPQPGYVDGVGSKDTVYLATGSRYIIGDPTLPASYAGGLGRGNIYRSTNGGDSFIQVNPSCPGVVAGGTITSMDIVESEVCVTGCQNQFMAIVGVSSIGTSGDGEGVYTWNQDGSSLWNDLQISNSMVAPPAPGAMPAGNGLDVIQVMGSRNYASDGLICAVANDIAGGDPAGEPAGIYVCFYDANDGTWGGDIDSPTNAAAASWLGPDYAGAACMDTGSDFNSVTGCYVFVGLDGCTNFLNNDVWRVRGLATVAGPSTVSSCSAGFMAIRISDIMIPDDANSAIYVGCEAPAGQAQFLCLAGGLTWPGAVPSSKPASGAWPVFVTGRAGAVMGAGGGDGATTSGVHKMVQTSRGTVFNGVGLLDDIAQSEDVPGYPSPYAGTWCLVEAVAEEVSPMYSADGLIYISTMSNWSNGLSLWRLTGGRWERIMYEGIILADGRRFAGKNILTSVGQYMFVSDRVWWPKVVPQFSSDGSMFLMGASGTGASYAETIWYSPDSGNDWGPLTQMPIGAAPMGAGLSESGWCVVDSNTLFVGDVAGWIYRTTNRGASWTEGALTGTGIEITSIAASPVYSGSGSSGTDGCIIAGTYDRNGWINEVWLSQDRCVKDLENIGDEIYVSPSWAGAPDGDLGGTVVNFDNNWFTNRVIYAAGIGWLDRWQLVGTGSSGAEDLNRIGYTDVGIVRTEVALGDPSASTWEPIWDADDWNAVAPKPQPIPGMVLGDTIYRFVAPTAIQIAPDGTVYVAFALWDSSYNFAGDMPTPNAPGYGRFTLGGTLRCLNATLAVPEFELLNDGLGPWDGLYLGRVIPGSNIAISLTFDWKEWRFKLAFYEDTLSSPGPEPVSPLTNTAGCGILVSNTSVNVQLKWQAGGNTSIYEWQLSGDAAFTSTKSGSTSSTGVTVTGLEPATSYYWRCRSLEPMTSRWSTTQEFSTVIGGYSGAAQLGTPEDGGAIADETPLFTWSAVAGASSYRIQVATDAGFDAANIIIDEEIGNVRAFEAGALANGTYYWRVKGINAYAGTESPWSSASFTLDTDQHGAPAWVWVLIIVGIVMGIILIVLILRTKRPVQKLTSTEPDSKDLPATENSED